MLKALSATLLFSVLSWGGPISIVSGSATATIQFDAGLNVVSLDVRSDAVLDTGVGTVATTDLAAPAPNSFLFVLDLGLTQAVAATLANPAFPTVTSLTLDSTGVPFQGTITDPGVAVFLGPVTYNFDLTNFDQATLVGTYTLVSAAFPDNPAVPEPATAALAFAALAGVVIRKLQTRD